MKVYSEARPGGGGKVIGITLTDDDMGDVEGFDALAAAQKWRALSDRADMMLVEYLLRRGDISQEYAAQRVWEIRKGSAA